MKVETLIKEVQSAGAYLEVKGGDLVVKRKRGSLSDHLINELRQNKTAVISALKAGQNGQPLDAGEYPDIIPGEERYPWQFVGDRVSFLLKGAVEDCLATKDAKFVQGVVLSQKWLGFTKAGSIPEYSLKIRTDDGVIHSRRLVEHYVS